MAKKRKFPKRKRRFNLQTQEGKMLAAENIKLCNAFPEETDRKAYLRAAMSELDRLIAKFPEKQKTNSTGVMITLNRS